MIAAWCAVVIVSPALCAALGYTRLDAGRLRGISTVAATLMLATAMAAPFSAELGGWALEPVPGGPLLRVDAVTSVLPALAAALWLFSVVVTPRMTLDPLGLQRIAAGTCITTVMFLSANVAVLVVAWGLSLLTTGAARRPPGGRPHAALGYLVGSALLLVAGAALATLPSLAGTTAHTVGLALIAAAALLRQGIFPFHAWVPALFDHERLGPAIHFCAPQLGTYVLVVLVVPHAPPELLRVIAVLALVSAVYAAALAVVQRSARRACAYLFMSQSALVVAGLDCTSHEALTGGLVLWLSSSLAFMGLARCVLVLEARRGRLDLSRHHGGYERKPLLAAAFLLLGLSCTGFPGTLGFIGEELLLGGAVEDFPLLGFLVVATGAFTGLAVLRMYFSLFAGAPGDVVRLDLRPREAAGFAAMVVLLIALGLSPTPAVRSRAAASEQLLHQRSPAHRRAAGAAFVPWAFGCGAFGAGVFTMSSGSLLALGAGGCTAGAQPCGRPYP